VLTTFIDEIGDLRRELQQKAPWLIPSVLLVAFFGWALHGAGGFSRFFQFSVLGVALGCLFAIAASGIVLTYTTTGVFNFAHGAVGMVAAYVFWDLDVNLNNGSLPTPAAFLITLVVVAPLLGLLFERIMRSFRGSSPATTLTVTIALTVMLIGVIQSVFPETDGRQRVVEYLFGSRTVTVLGARVGWDRAFVLLLAILIAVFLRLLLFRSRTGTAMRAVVDNAELAALNGAAPVTIARYSWLLGSLLASLGGMLFVPGSGSMSPTGITFFVLNAYGAAVFGKLRSLPLTFVGAILLGMALQYHQGSMLFGKTEFWSHFGISLNGVFLFGSLLLLPQARLTVGRVVGRDTPRVPNLGSSLIRCVPVVALLAIVPQVTGDYLPDVTKGFVFATLILSIVLLTGYSGQISLAQYVFFALGAFAMGKIGDTNSALGLLAAAGIAIPFGVITALPALRLQGLYLALVTFAVAAVSDQLILNDRRIFGVENVAVPPVKLLGVDFSSAKALCFFCSIVFVLVGLFVLALRRGPFGRRLAAMRDSEAACATLGLDVRRTKLVVFVLSSAIAGLAGALFGVLSGSVGTTAFNPLNNIVLFLFAFVGGVTTITGALLGGMLFSLLPLAQSKAAESGGFMEVVPGLIFAGVAVTAILLGKQPNGIAGQLFAMIDRWRRPARTSSDERHDERPREPSPMKEEVAVGATT
jgi:branched-chain amino acid transport system permease protein